MNPGIKEREFRDQNKNLEAMTRREKCQYIERHGLDRFLKLVRDTYKPGKAQEDS